MTRIQGILDKRIITEEDFKVLLSPEAEIHLEAMADRVNKEHKAHFGNAIVLYTPIYIANHCINQCVYCSYNAGNVIRRHQLTYEEIEKEAKAVYSTGIRHVLLLTGESPIHTPFDYIIKAAKILKTYFDSVTVEVYPLTTDQYRALHEIGVDGLTIYQETYDRDIYQKVHPYGPKSDYDYRLTAPARGAQAGLYHINIGALLGLKDWREDVLALGQHLKSLEKAYPKSHYSVSVPRIRPYNGQMFESETITDRNLVQIMLALKLYAPKMGLNISTRESEVLREHLLPLGVAKMSAGVTTAVGGHSEVQGDPQFEISDTRSVQEIMTMLKDKGYQAVMKDWVTL